MLLIVILTINSSLHAQSWLWGMQGRDSFSSSAVGTKVATDKQGNAYIANSYWDTIVFNTDTLKNQAGFFLVKYNSAGIVQWAIQPVESKHGYSYCTSMASDNSGNIYMVGNFDDTITFGSYTLKQRQGYYSVFIVKYDSDGNVIWARQSSPIYGGALNFVSIATDLAGNAYLTGPVPDTLSFGPDTLISSPLRLGTVFVVKYDPNGNVKWARQSISALNSLGSITYSISCDRSGNSYITGSFSDSITFGAFTLTSRSGEAYLVKYDSSGNVLWANASSSPTANGNGYPFSVTNDNAGNVYITGGFSDTISFGNKMLFSHGYGSLTVFLVKYDANGNALWAEQSSDIAHFGFDEISYLTHDTVGYIYLAFASDTTSIKFGGHTFSSNFKPTMYNSMLCIAKLDTSGNVECGSAINSSFYPRTFNTLAADNAGKYIYTAGTLESDSIIFSNDTLREKKGNEQPYLARWQPCIITIDTSKYIPGPCDNLSVPNVFTPNNDGINDDFVVNATGVNSFSIIIYNRWGEQVFANTNPSVYWNGRVNATDDLVPDGTYYYIINAGCGATNSSKAGFVQVIGEK